MKRLFQFAALLMAVFLASQPAVAGMSCRTGMDGGESCASHCEQQMSRMGMMGMDCAGPGCGQMARSQDCSQCWLQPAIVAFGAGAKSKIVRVHWTAAVAETGCSPRVAFAGTPWTDRPGTGPPRYILHCVFRI
jgi:hypothetical protein